MCLVLQPSCLFPQAKVLQRLRDEGKTKEADLLHKLEEQQHAQQQLWEQQQAEAAKRLREMERRDQKHAEEMRRQASMADMAWASDSSRGWYRIGRFMKW